MVESHLPDLAPLVQAYWFWFVTGVTIGLAAGVCLDLLLRGREKQLEEGSPPLGSLCPILSGLSLHWSAGRKTLTARQFIKVENLTNELIDYVAVVSGSVNGTKAAPVKFPGKIYPRKTIRLVGNTVERIPVPIAPIHSLPNVISEMHYAVNYKRAVMSKFERFSSKKVVTSWSYNFDNGPPAVALTSSIGFVMKDDIER